MVGPRVQTAHSLFGGGAMQGNHDITVEKWNSSNKREEMIIYIWKVIWNIAVREKR
jgi:hypothetical protein